MLVPTAFRLSFFQFPNKLFHNYSLTLRGSSRKQTNNNNKILIYSFNWTASLCSDRLEGVRNLTTLNIILLGKLSTRMKVWVQYGANNKCKNKNHILLIGFLGAFVYVKKKLVGTKPFLPSKGHYKKCTAGQPDRRFKTF